MSELEKMVLETVRFPRWPGLSDADRQALDNLEELAATVNMDEEMKEGGNMELSRFAGEVYRILHWVSAPHCRKNHLNWDPAVAKPYA